MFLCVLNIFYLCVVERLQSLFINGWLVGHKTCWKRAWGSGFFFRCICRFESVSDSSLRTWVNSLSEEVTTSDEPPTHAGCSVLSEWIGESGMISREYSETWATRRSFLKCCTCFNSSEKWWKSPCCSQPVWQSEAFALHVLSQGAPSSCAAALYQDGRSAPAGGRAGLPESPKYLNFPTCCGGEI